VANSRSSRRGANDAPHGILVHAASSRSTLHSDAPCRCSGIKLAPGHRLDSLPAYAEVVRRTSWIEVLRAAVAWLGHDRACPPHRDGTRPLTAARPVARGCKSPTRTRPPLGVPGAYSTTWTLVWYSAALLDTSAPTLLVAWKLDDEIPVPHPDEAHDTRSHGAWRA